METPEQCVKYFTKWGKPGLVPSDTEIEDSKYINWNHSWVAILKHYEKGPNSYSYLFAVPRKFY